MNRQILSMLIVIAQLELARHVDEFKPQSDDEAHANRQFMAELLSKISVAQARYDNSRLSEA